MGKGFKVYAVIWAICLVLFSAVVFLVPIERSGSFWIGYVFITLAFCGQLGCTYVAFQAENLKKMFYSIPLISVSYAGLLIMLIAGTACMAIPGIPGWLGVIICLLVLGVTAIAVITAGAAAHVVDKTDAKITAQTGFIKNLTVDAEILIQRANAPMLKNHCKKVYEALRYSDPMSNASLLAIEQRIQEEFDALTDAVIADDLDCTESAAKELLTLIAHRNQKCKLSK